MAATDAPDKVPLDSMAKLDQSVDIDTLFGVQSMLDVKTPRFVSLFLTSIISKQILGNLMW